MPGTIQDIVATGQNVVVAINNLSKLFGQLILGYATYTTGTWIPSVTFATPGDVAVTYSFRQGDYTKIGSLVVANFNLSTATFTHTTAAGVLEIAGLPFAASANNFYSGSGSATGWVSAGASLALFSNLGATYLNYATFGSGLAYGTLDTTNVASGGTPSFYGTIAYQIA